MLASSTPPKTCFVISPFGEPFDTYFSKILKPAIEKCGLFAARGDSLFRPSTIVDDIWQSIQAASVLVAELTGRNANVFYELGLAHAISKPVVLLSQSIDDVPFDLRGIRTLIYDKDQPDWGQSLRADLTRSIKEVLANPALAVPSTFKDVVEAERPTESEALVRIEALEAAVRSLSTPTSTRFPSEDFTYSPTTRLHLPKGAKPGPALKVSQKVRHPKFGLGTVISIEGHGLDERVQVNFDRHGVKWLAQAVARMRPEDE